MAQFICYECKETINSVDDLIASVDMVYDRSSWYTMSYCPYCGVAYWLIKTDNNPMKGGRE